MNSFISVIKADWDNGIWRDKFKFVVPFVVSSVSCGIFLNSLYSYFTYKGISERASLLEYLMYLFKGMKEYNPDEGKIFELPILFVVLNLYLAYLIGDYAVRDLKGYGMQLLLKTGSKIKWWISKCIWNVATVLLFYFFVFAGAVCVWLVFEGMDGSLFQFNDSIFQFILGKNREGFGYNDIILFFIVLILTSVVISLCQMAISLYLKPLVSFGFVVILYIVSGYYTSNFLLGNYMMLYRSHIVNAWFGLGADIILLVVVTVGGYILFRKRDLL